MKCLSIRLTGLLLVAITLIGCNNLRMNPPFGLLTVSADWVTLIDGERGIENFNRLGDANWLAMHGAIQSDRMNSGEGAGYLVTKNTYKDFQIYAEFWADEEANSGIFIRMTNPKEITAKNAYEVNIFDKRPGPEYGTGAIVNYAKVNPMPKAAGKWNTYLITAKGDQLTVELNGVVTANVADKSFPAGPFALQYGKGIIKWRKVMVRPI